MYRTARKFGGLAVYLCNFQIKICQYFILTYIRMVIPYQTDKLKSANIFAMAIWRSTTKFFFIPANISFRLYSILINSSVLIILINSLRENSIMSSVIQSSMGAPCGLGKGSSYHNMWGIKLMSSILCLVRLHSIDYSTMYVPYS